LAPKKTALLLSSNCHIPPYNKQAGYTANSGSGRLVSKKQIKVLVVEDEPAIREMIRFALSKSDFKVRYAADGRKALLKINDKPPDIILLDWMMPNMSGPQLIRRLRKDSVTTDIPVIMLTAKVSEDDKVTGLNTGADDYIVKPFSPKELIARINAGSRRQ
jgi:two-component system phosphate regulon response regulator PhoB